MILIYEDFQLLVGGLRNDGVRCSNHLSGTTFPTIAKEGIPPHTAGRAFAWVRRLGPVWGALGRGWARPTLYPLKLDLSV